MSFSKKGKKSNYLFLPIKQLTESLFNWHLKMQFSIIYTEVQHLKQEEEVESVCSAAQAALAEGLHWFPVVFLRGAATGRGTQAWILACSLMPQHPWAHELRQNIYMVPLRIFSPQRCWSDLWTAGKSEGWPYPRRCCASSWSEPRSHHMSTLVPDQEFHRVL